MMDTKGSRTGLLVGGVIGAAVAAVLTLVCVLCLMGWAYIQKDQQTRLLARDKAELAQQLDNVEVKASHLKTCRYHLKQIDSSKEQWAMDHLKRFGDVPSWADLAGPGKYMQGPLFCPDGGTYTLGAIGDTPTCSVSMHTIEAP